MKPLSYSQRITAGFGTIALGICASLPFRRTPDPAEMVPDVTAQSGLALSADVALQLPGKPPATPEIPPASPEWDTPGEQGERVARADTNDHLKMVPLPSLPDRFQALDGEQSAVSPKASVISEPPQLPQPVVQVRRHRIRDGDTLESLALRYLDDEARAHEIFEANRGLLSDPMLLPIGVELTIPTGDRLAVASTPTENSVEGDTGQLVPLPRRFGR
jgi:nucleoid-associated protein YgaU